MTELIYTEKMFDILYEQLTNNFIIMTRFSFDNLLCRNLFTTAFLGIVRLHKLNSYPNEHRIMLIPKGLINQNKVIEDIVNIIRQYLNDIPLITFKNLLKCRFTYRMDNKIGGSIFSISILRPHRDEIHVIIPTIKREWLKKFDVNFSVNVFNKNHNINTISELKDVILSKYENSDFLIPPIHWVERCKELSL